MQTAITKLAQATGKPEKTVMREVLQAGLKSYHPAPRKITHTPIASLRGAAGTLKQPHSWHEIERIVQEDMAQAYTKNQQ